jgi:SAM-dependent methyltransferase
VDPHIETNRALWNGWTGIHEKSAFYDVAGFRAGASTLKHVEVEEVGSVEGKRLLHLQCHFGMDTLSWARRGARVTGVDLSDAAIELARSLAGETGLEARFLRSDLYHLPQVLAEEFDVVFTSYGVLPWLPEIRRWGEIVARYLKPGGTFYLVEFHPLADVVDEDGRTLRHPYFHSPEPLEAEQRGSYADPEADLTHPAFFWSHTLGDVVSALAAAGLRIEFVHEFPYSVYNCFPYVEEREPGRWWPRESAGSLPLMFSIRASR